MSCVSANQDVYIFKEVSSSRIPINRCVITDNYDRFAYCDRPFGSGLNGIQMDYQFHFEIHSDGKKGLYRLLHIPSLFIDVTMMHSPFMHIRNRLTVRANLTIGSVR